MTYPAADQRHHSAPTTSLSSQRHPTDVFNLWDYAEAAARALDGHADYRVLRRVRPRAATGRRSRRASEQLLILLDTETTGIDSRRHEIVELAMLAVVHDAHGEVLGLLEAFSARREPSITLPAAITAITDLTPAMVAGQVTDGSAVARFVAGADRACCHNAAFDRGFVERLSPAFADLPWACSLREVDWAAIGTVGTRLEHILGYFGLFHDGHRAVHDCHALLAILTQPHPAGGSILRHLIAASDRTTARIVAVNAPFDRKDDLKSRGYRWGDGSDGRPKGWWIEVDEASVEAELAVLRRDIDRSGSTPLVDRLTAVERFKVPSASRRSRP